jgi:hypothetical protein
MLMKTTAISDDAARGRFGAAYVSSAFDIRHC